jgi:hypothetical protein
MKRKFSLCMLIGCHCCICNNGANVVNFVVIVLFTCKAALYYYLKETDWSCELPTC